ncbi:MULTISPECIES: hypothetical protein [Nostocales]|uniref:hypothetical protein n=1 Tax=Nostocales TaxID=1161 RepID=UPI0016875381|nr:MULTISPECIES: hypothetical protein [Nostocales]MBD2298204.1 hypothetical protein [Nostoc sp. FACHB-190]MBD2489362.1 hypothetical protein [Aulosira sp. FACHB-615]
MATITPTRPDDTSTQTRLIILEPRATFQLYSPEGQKIAEVTENALQVLAQIKEYLEYIKSVGEIDYNPVPPKRSERVVMRVRFQGRKPPQPYVLDEE